RLPDSDMAKPVATGGYATGLCYGLAAGVHSAAATLGRKAGSAARAFFSIGFGHHLSSHSENRGLSFGITFSAKSFVLDLVSSLDILPYCKSSIRWPTFMLTATSRNCSTTSSG